MSFLSKIIGDNHQLKGPDISKAPTFTMDLSGTKLMMPVPPKTLMIPTVIQQASLDILNPELFERWDEDVRTMSVDIHGNGWEFKGKLGRDFGYIMLDVRLIKIEAEEPLFSFFDLQSFKVWLLRYADDFWGELNRSKIKEHNGASPKKYLWSYPTANEHIYEAQSQEKSVYFFTSRPKGGIQTNYWVPITPHHVLEFAFISSPVECDFYSPEHNFPDATAQFIKEFMQNVTITLSPDALAQKLAAEQNLLSSKENLEAS